MTHALRGDDGFDNGSVEYGDAPSLYARGGYHEFGATYTLSTFSRTFSWNNFRATLHDGFSQGLGTPPYDQTAPMYRAQIGTASAVDWDLPVSMVLRDLESSNDAAVEATFVYCPTGITGDTTTIDDWYSFVGVMARCQDGVVFDPGGAQEYLAFSKGYVFGLMRDDSTDNTRFVLIRFDTLSTPVILSDAGYPLPATATSFANGAITPKHPFTMRMELEDESGDVRIRCHFRRQSNGISPIGSSVAEDIEVFSILDNAANKITTAGRFGFASTPARASADTNQNVANIQSFLHAFQVEDNGSLVHRDEMRRYSRGGALTITDIFGKTGADLRCGYTGDGRSDSSHLGQMERSTVLANRVKVDAATEFSGIFSAVNRGGMYLSQRVSPTINNRRSVVVRFDSTGTAGSNPIYAGLSLRVTAGTVDGIPGSNSTGGYSVLGIPDATDGSFQIVHFLSNGLEVVVGTKSGTGVCVFDTDYKVEMEIITIDAGTGDPADNVVQIKCLVDNVQVVWDSATPPNGFEILANGTVNHFGSTKTLTARGEALRAVITDGARLVYFSDYTVESAPVDPETAEFDEPSIALSAEGGAATTELFPVHLSWSLEFGEGIGVVSHTYDSGHTARTIEHGKTRRRWRSTITGLTPAERATFNTFRTGKKNSIPFKLDLNDGKANVLVRFIRGANVINGKASSVTVSVEEVFA